MEERLGIAGSGTIACGLAATVSARGEVVMWVRSEDSARRAADRLGPACEKADGAERERVRVVTDPQALAAAEPTFVVEAIAEDAGAKSALLATLNGVLPRETVVATTTSSLSVGELAAASGRADRFLGFHVFNPVPAMKLVEIVPGPATSPETRERARALCAALDKVAVEVPDRPGFVVNRLLFPYLFGAVRLLEESELEPEAVDTCMKLGAGHPLGPLALLDLVGLDVAAAIGEELSIEVPARVRELIAAGALGRKAGRGFFAY